MKVMPGLGVRLPGTISVDRQQLETKAQLTIRLKLTG
jgi:hypothetical protein